LKYATHILTLTPNLIHGSAAKMYPLRLCCSFLQDGVFEDCPRPRGQKKSWPWPWSRRPLALDLAFASSQL